MVYTVTVSSRIYSTDDNQNQRADFRIPTTDFRSVASVQLPSVLNYIIEESSSLSVDLTQFGSKMRMLAVKSTRPITMQLLTSDVTYSYPPSTYFHQLVNSAEDLAPRATSLILTVPPAATTTLSTRPPRYPKALVEMFVLFE